MKKEMLETAVNEIMGSAVVSVGDYQRILTKIVAECLDRGYIIRTRPRGYMDTDINLESSKADDTRGRIKVSTKCRRLTPADGFPNGSMCHMVNLSVTRPCGLVIAERRWYWKANDNNADNPLHGGGAMWNTAEEALSAARKMLDRRNNAPNMGLDVDENIVKRFYGNDALRLHTNDGKNVLSLLNSDGRGAKVEDIFSVNVRHTCTEGFVETAYTVHTRNGDSRTWSFDYNEDPLRRERRACRDRRMVYVHGEPIPVSLCGKGQPHVYAETVVGVKRNAPYCGDGDVLGYFLLTTHPVYGFTYAVVDRRGGLLKNGYLPKGEVEDVKDVFIQIAERYGLFRCFGFDELRFMESAPLSVVAAATYAPLGVKMYHALPRDLADISAEGWNRERHIVRDGDIVNICGGHDAAGYRFRIEKAGSNNLELRSDDGAPCEATLNVFIADEYVVASARIAGDWASTPIVLTPRDKKELREILRSLKTK